MTLASLYIPYLTLGNIPLPQNHYITSLLLCQAVYTPATSPIGMRCNVILADTSSVIPQNDGETKIIAGQQGVHI